MFNSYVKLPEGILLRRYERSRMAFVPSEKHSVVCRSSSEVIHMLRQTNAIQRWYIAGYLVLSHFIQTITYHYCIHMISPLASIPFIPNQNFKDLSWIILNPKFKILNYIYIYTDTYIHISLCSKYFLIFLCFYIYVYTAFKLRPSAMRLWLLSCWWPGTRTWTLTICWAAGMLTKKHQQNEVLDWCSIFWRSYIVI